MSAVDQLSHYAAIVRVLEALRPIQNHAHAIMACEDAIVALACASGLGLSMDAAISEAIDIIRLQCAEVIGGKTQMPDP